MDEKLFEKFCEWFYAQENYGLRAERFYNDAIIDDDLTRDAVLSVWIKTAFEQGAEAMKSLKENGS